MRGWSRRSSGPRPESGRRTQEKRVVPAQIEATVIEISQPEAVCARESLQRKEEESTKRRDKKLAKRVSSDKPPPAKEFMLSGHVS